MIVFIVRTTVDCIEPPGRIYNKQQEPEQVNHTNKTI
jgi:hypothetical protein